MVRRSMNRNQLHDQNLKFVLQQIFNNHPTSRIEISHQLNLNKSTVSSLYNTLMADGYLTELGLGEASNAGGRKPTLIEINRNYGFTLTFDLGYRHLHALVTYLNGQVWKYDRIETKGQSIHEMIDQINHYIAAVQAEDTTRHGLLGICFSIHGIVMDNQIKTSPFIDMDGIDLEQVFSTMYQVPVVLENEANLSAVYERDFNGARDLNSTVTVSIHRGIGAGIILQRELFRGEHGDAGEIGQTVVSIEMDDAGAGHPVHAEDISSEGAIIQQLEQKKGITNLDRTQLVALYQKQDADTLAVLTKFTTAIGGLIYNLMRSLDPDAFFINSPLVEEIPTLLMQIRTVYQNLAHNALTIDLTQNARLATVLGGCSLITHRALGLDHYELNFERPATETTA